MRHLLIGGLAVLAAGCAAGPGSSQLPACTGSPNEPVGCTAKIAFEGTTYLDRGYVALVDDAPAKLTASGTLTAAVEWLPSPDPDAAPRLPVPAEAQFAGASVWAVQGIDPQVLVLLGPFPQEWEPNLYELFLVQGGSKDPPVALCPYIERATKANPPLICQGVSQVP
jgi:hypothetical protein